MNITILRYESLESTNTEAAHQARLGADEGLCVIARQQTAGRGRQGRIWVSEKDAGLYFSIVLRPKIEMRSFPLITLMTGIAVHDALQEFGLDPDIKWVNDILIGEKKICGILAETVETGKDTAVIVGIGINLTSRAFADDIAETATSIHAESGKQVPPDIVAETVTKYLIYFYDIFSGTDAGTRIIELWQKRSSYFSGKKVRVAVDSETLDGTTDGLEKNGALRVKLADGSVRIIQAGDVQRLRANNENT